MPKINDIATNSSLISQPVKDNFNLLNDGLKNSIIEHMGYGVIKGLVVSAQTTPDMTVNVSTGIAYLPSGDRVSISSTNLTIVNPTTVLHTAEVHTTDVNGVFTTDLKPITKSNGNYAVVGDTTVKKTADSSVVTVSTLTASTGVVDTSLVVATSIKIDYYHGQQRKDIIIINEQGGLQIIQGTPANSNPTPPNTPTGALKLAEISVTPKSAICITTADITIIDSNKGIYLDANYNLVVEQDLVVKGSQSIGNTVNEVLVVRDNINNDQTGEPVVIADDLSVTGNLTVAGTIDGRDVSTDGATLDAHIIKQAIPTSTDVVIDKHVSNAMTKEWEDHVGGTGNVHTMTHNQLNSIGQADPTLTDTSKDKHVSNAQAKKWEDHANSSHLALGETTTTAYRGDRGASAYNHSISTGNIHSTTHAQLSSVLGVSTASTDTNLTKHISDALSKGWEDHRVATGNTHSTTHAQLSGIGTADATSVDTVLDKHVSNSMTKSWTDHVGASAPHSGHATTTALTAHTGSTSNPHNVTHSQTNPAGADVVSTDTTKDKHVSNAMTKKWEDHTNSSHLALGTTSTTAYAGDKGNTAYTHSQATGNAHSTTHAQLSGITGVTTTSTDIVLDKHVSDNLAKGWEDHRNASAPHSGHALITHAHTVATTTTDGFISSTDFTKLAGIEAGATADMTATEILSSLKLVDGTGSGVDADLLDGHESTYFATSDHTHDTRYYTETETDTKLVSKLDSASYTASDVLIKIKSVDGTGSGLDADLLDGLASGNASGNIPISNGTVNTNLNADKLDGYDAGNASGNVPVSNGTLNTNLNADRLDSLESTSFLRSDANTTLTGILTINKQLEALRVKGTNSDYILSVQDTAGRVEHFWNSTAGTAPTFIKATENAGKLGFDPSAFDTQLFSLDYANGASAIAGSAITWTNVLKVGSLTFTYNGNKVWHEGNDGSASGLDADKLDGQDGSYYQNVGNMNAGTLAIARGGTNNTTYTTSKFLVYDGSKLASSSYDSSSFATSGHNHDTTYAKNAFTQLSDGTTIASADSLTGKFTLSSGNNILGIAVNATTDTATFTIAQANIDHGSISGLSDDDHPQYLQKGTNGIITAQHNFNPATAQAPFTLGVNAQGQLVTGLNADKLDGKDATSFANSIHSHAVGDITGILPLTNGGTNNSIYTASKFLIYDGTKLTSSSYDNTSFATSGHNHDSYYSKLAYANITDGSVTASAGSKSDAFKLRSANTILTVGVTSDDVTHGDNALFTVNQANIDHGTIGGLTDDDHTQYVHNTVARTISAKHTFNTGDAVTKQAPFVIGTYSYDQLVGGLNADKLDGNDASAFALTSHNHSTDNLTSGTLPVARGGTNNTAYTSNQFVLFDGTKLASSGYTSSSFATASHNHAVADISGILPITKGGTNNSTFTTNKFVLYDGGKFASSSYDSTSFSSSDHNHDSVYAKSNARNISVSTTAPTTPTTYDLWISL